MPLHIPLSGFPQDVATLQNTQPTVHVVIPTHARRETTLTCLESLERQTYAPLRVIVVDAGSTDGTTDAVRGRFPRVEIVQCGDEAWWAGATNEGVRLALESGNPDDLVLTLNDDTICPSDYIATLVKAHRSRRAIVGSVAVDTNAVVLDAGVQVDWWTAKFRRQHRGRRLAACHGALDGSWPADLLAGRGTLVPLAAYREVGLYADYALPHYGADYEFIARARRHGWSIEVCGLARLQALPHLTGIDPRVARLSLRQMLLSLVSRRSSNCLWYRWVFAVLACPRPQVVLFLPLDSLRAIVGMVLWQLRLRASRQHPSARRP